MPRLKEFKQSELAKLSEHHAAIEMLKYKKFRYQETVTILGNQKLEIWKKMKDNTTQYVFLIVGIDGNVTTAISPQNPEVNEASTWLRQL